MHLKEGNRLGAETYKSCLSPLFWTFSSYACVQRLQETIMDKYPVTRAFSFGAISGGTRALEDFPTARRNSSAGIRALLWATSSAKSFGCSTDSQTSRENIFPNILTPDSIPQFTIPSLSVQTSLRSLNTEMEDNDAEPGGDLKNSRTEPESPISPCCTISSSSSSSSSSLILSDRRAERSVSDPLTKRRSALQREVHSPRSCKDTQHCLDPVSRAALSLPHLTKVTTPYGFVTLSQSPQMASEEALLCQAGLRCLTSDDKNSCSFGKTPEINTKGTKSNCTHLSSAKKKLSKPSADSQSKGGLVRGESQAHFNASASVSSSSTAKHPDKLKRSFYNIIKKHFM